MRLPIYFEILIKTRKALELYYYVLTLLNSFDTVLITLNMPISEKLQYNYGERENLYYLLSFKWKGLCTFEAAKEALVRSFCVPRFLPFKSWLNTYLKLKI